MKEQTNMKEKLSVVIPCYNSEKNIGNVINEDIQIFNELKIEEYEFILVNDCSSDNTWNTVKELSKKSKIIAINLAKNTGQQGAIILFMSGIMFCVVGLTGEYVGRIYMCINNTPQYIIKEVSSTIEKRKK